MKGFMFGSLFFVIYNMFFFFGSFGFYVSMIKDVLEKIIFEGKVCFFVDYDYFYYILLFYW